MRASNFRTPHGQVEIAHLGIGDVRTDGSRPHIRFRKAAASRLWVLEGWNQTNRNDVWHSADGTTWSEVPGTPWKPRHAASVFVHADALWMVAGNNMESDVWKLTKK